MIDPRDVDSRSDLAEALRALRERAGRTVRDLGREIDLAPATLGGWLTGRHVPNPSQRRVFHALLVACGEPSDRLDDWSSALTRARTPRVVAVAGDDRPPYPGLRPFEPDDAELFFGRAEEIDEVLRRLRVPAAVVVVLGPSGSGKSSLLRAGVVPAVRGGALDAGPARPAGVRLTTPAAHDEDGGDDDVLVIDQAEELFTVCTPAERADILGRLAARPGPVVLGLRSDFYSAAAREPVLLDALRRAQVVLGPLDRSRLEQAILAPATAAGLTVEDGLVDLVLADLAPHEGVVAAHDAGALPLLAHALLATWEHRFANRLTVAGYRAAGGIDAAVQRTAEAVFDRLDAGQRELARRVFVRLVDVAGDVAVTRRRVSRTELDRLCPAGGAGAVVDAFVAGRLLTTHADVVEISHEALLSAWPRLRDWIDSDRAGLRVHRQITEAANAWYEADRESGLLLRGLRLDAAVDATADPSRAAELDEFEREFVRVSTAAAARDRNRDRRRTRRLRRLLAAVVVLLLAAAGLAAYAQHARSRAEAAQQTAALARDEARSRQVAFQARDLDATDPALAAQLALVAYRIAPTDAARGALIDQSTSAPVTRITGAVGPTPLAVAPGGRLIATGRATDGAVQLFSLTSEAGPRPIATLPGPGRGHQLFALAFSPDRRLLATAGEQHVVTLWDVSDPRIPRRLGELPGAFDQAVEGLAFIAGGSRIVAVGGGRIAVRMWDARTRAPQPVPAALTGLGVGQSLDANGPVVAVGAGSGRVLVWTPATGHVRPLPTTFAAAVYSLRFADGGRRLYVGAGGGGLTGWNLSAPVPVRVAALDEDDDSRVNTIAVSSDDRHVVFGRSDDHVEFTDAGLSEPTRTIGNPGPVVGMALSGSTLLWTAADGALRSTALVPPTVSAPQSVFAVDYGRTAALLAVADSAGTGGVRLWDQSALPRPVPRGPRMTGRTPIDGTGAVTDDGRLVAAGGHDGRVTLWDTSSPGHPIRTADFAAATDIVEYVGFVPGRDVLAVADDDRTVGLWNVHDRRRPVRVATLPVGGIAFSVAFTPDGRTAAVADSGGTADLWDVSDPSRPVRLATLGGFASYVYGVAFSTDGRRLAASSADRTARVWNVGDRRRPRAIGQPLTGPGDYALAVAFSPDGGLLAVGSEDSTVRLYRHAAAGWTQIASLTAPGPVFTTAFSPDGHQVVAGGRFADVASWTLDATTVSRRLCPLAGSPITTNEWSLYVPGVPYDPPCR